MCVGVCWAFLDSHPNPNPKKEEVIEDSISSLLSVQLSWLADPTVGVSFVYAM
jgi:hypothetical protein